ncbi:mitochondrial carrier protein MTM1-like isoform X2 [Phragmites australis]|uniref:mitochondrial carrier protein MTM1-like isoform X2 n=1 Tax=Phragmites australis TaxID=29695 RepID=UPI002D79F4AF|nr:mitochondrial carrier protein MTM1-like isoform X2 [Phragmites australis]
MPLEQRRRSPEQHKQTQESQHIAARAPRVPVETAGGESRGEASCRVERRPPCPSLALLPNSSAAARSLRPSFASPVPFTANLLIRPSSSRLCFPTAMEQEASEPSPPPPPAAERDLGFAERAVAAAGAAVVSAVLVNPLDVAKTRLQAQAAGVVYNPIWSDFRCYPSCSTGGINGLGPSCSPECFQYRGTMDVFSKVTRQEGFFRLWRGTSASLALAIPTVGIYLPSYDLLRNWIEEYSDHNFPKLRPYAPLISGSIARSLACITCSPIELARTRMQAFKESNVGGKPPGMWRTLLGVLSSRQSISSPENVRGYHLLWTGLGAQLARDVPFSAICWTVLEPIRRHLTGLVADKSNAAVILGANFSAGFVAGVISAGATCPLDVAKTRRQIEDPERVLSMNTRRILLEVWRNEGINGLFRGAGPRMGRAGPSVGIVVSSYEVVKHIMHRKHAEL